jgi:hypothetical protein
MPIPGSDIAATAVADRSTDETWPPGRASTPAWCGWPAARSHAEPSIGNGYVAERQRSSGKQAGSGHHIGPGSRIGDSRSRQQNQTLNMTIKGMIYQKDWNHSKSLLLKAFSSSL